MKKKINLNLAVFLLGGLTAILPVILKICLFTAIALVLWTSYDEYDYMQRNGGNR